MIEENLPSLYWINTNSCPVVRLFVPCISLRIWQNTNRPFAGSSLRNSFIFKCNCRRSSPENRVQGSGLVLNWSPGKVTAVKENLPFPLTQAQEKSLQEIFDRHEVRSPHESSPARVGSGRQRWSLAWLCLRQ